MLGARRSRYRQSGLEGFAWNVFSVMAPPRARTPERLQPWRSSNHPGIASELGLHPVYFARRFRTYFRCSPAEYRTRCRLRQAMHLLCKTDQSLADNRASPRASSIKATSPRHSEDTSVILPVCTESSWKQPLPASTRLHSSNNHPCATAKIDPGDPST